MEEVIINGKKYSIDIEKCKEQGLLVEEVKYPKSWEDYKQCYIENDTPKGCCLRYHPSLVTIHDMGTAWSFKEKAEVDAYVALGKLIQLRDWWWDHMCAGWRPNSADNYVIIRGLDDSEHMTIEIDESWGELYTLVFPTEEIRDKFLETYRDLINDAKMFL